MIDIKERTESGIFEDILRPKGYKYWHSEFFGRYSANYNIPCYIKWGKRDECWVEVDKENIDKRERQATVLGLDVKLILKNILGKKSAEKRLKDGEFKEVEKLNDFMYRWDKSNTRVNQYGDLLYAGANDPNDWEVFIVLAMPRAWSERDYEAALLRDMKYGEKFLKDVAVFTDKLKRELASGRKHL